MRIKNTSNKGNIHNMNNIKNTALLFCMLLTSMMVQAQGNGNRLSVGVGALYEKGFDASLAVSMKRRITTLGNISPTVM